MKQALTLIAALILFTGCATKSPRTVVYQSLGTTKELTYASVRTAASLHAAKKITDNEWFNLSDKFDNKFKPAFQLAVDLAKQDYTAITPVDLGRLADEIIDTVTTLSKR